jgi:ribosome-associated translation inhibitor RaiA
MLDKQFDLDNDAVFVRAELGANTGHASDDRQFRAEVNLDASSIHLRSVSESTTLKAAIDEMKDDLLRQVVDYREKETDLARKRGAEAKELNLQTDTAQAVELTPDSDLR